MISYSKEEWSHRAQEHFQKTSRWTKPHRQRRSLQQKHPIDDFLFDYYSFRPSLLEKWSPGFGVFLKEASPVDLPIPREWTETTHDHHKGITLSPEQFPIHRRESFKWIIQLLEITLQRSPQWGCYGLHEWAMVYRIPEVRYPEVPLRMSAKDLASFVESQSLVCTHYDAFRFYTPEAKPLNRHALEKSNRLDFEQSGCLHVNMDLYKWHYKFFPWVPSEWVLESFILALEARQIDMRASPYDFRSWGIDPIPIETPEGKLCYIESQKSIYQKSLPLRKRLFEFYKNGIAKNL